MWNRKQRLLGWIVIPIAILVFIILIVVTVRTFTYPFSKTKMDHPETNRFFEPSSRSVERLCGGIAIATVSEAVNDEKDNPFDAFKTYLEEAYPAIYAALDTATVNRYGLIFHWKGSDANLSPILFCSHYDVVPVSESASDVSPCGQENREAGTSTDAPADKPAWKHPPFSGTVADGRIYGRGTLDMKGMLFSILEAADTLIRQGFVPDRDIWFAFGFDEEIGGSSGALQIAQYFKDRGLRFDAVYDEGGIIAAPGLAGIDRAVALIGTAEKGLCTIRIRVKGVGGHSSMPAKKSSLVLAAEIIRKLDAHQFDARLTAPVSAFLKNVGGYMPFTTRLAISNQWLLRDVLLDVMGKNPATNALVRTTTAITMAEGSNAPNVISPVAEVVVNFRILPGQTVSDVEKHVARLCKDYDTEIETVSGRNPSGTSPQNTRGFEIIGESLAAIYPDALATAYLTIGGTDSYKYQLVSDNIYRFMPVCLTAAEQETIHNDNESITLENYAKMIDYFQYIMEHF